MPIAATNSTIQALTGTHRMHPREAAVLSQAVAQDLGDRYDLQAYVSRGTFATVWKAFDKVAGTLVACKRFEEHLVDTTSFYQELRVCFRLNHPNVVRIINFLEVPDGPRYLFLEYCEGGTLRRLLSEARHKGQSLDERLVRSLATQIVQGLVEAHRYGLIHRDLKPENILRTNAAPEAGKEVIKITDFGLARMLRHRTGSVSQDNLKLSGSPAYMAPEQFNGTYSPASDLYSLGVILFELLHGTLPFSGTATDLADLHAEKPPQVSDHVSPKWRALLLDLLEKDPLRRPLANDVLDTLNDLTSTQVVPNLPQSDPRSRCLGVVGRDLFLSQSGTNAKWMVVAREGIFQFRQGDARFLGGFPIANASCGQCSESGALFAVVANRIVHLRGENRLTNVFTLPMYPARGLAVTDLAELRFAVVLKDRLLCVSHGKQKESTWTRWRSPDSRAVCLTFLDDGTLACTEADQTVLSLFDTQGEQITQISLPGSCKQLQRFQNKLLGRFVVEGESRIYGIDPDNGVVEMLPKSEGVIHIAAGSSTCDSIYGLRSTGEVLRWGPAQVAVQVCRFPKHDGPYVKLAGDGAQFAALGGSQEPMWLHVDNVAE